MLILTMNANPNLTWLITFLSIQIFRTFLVVIDHSLSIHFQNDIFAYFFQSYPIKQPYDPENPHLKNSKKPFASRIMQSVHGYFQVQ